MPPESDAISQGTEVPQVVPEGELVPVAPSQWTPKWVELAKSLFCRDLTDEETAFFLAVAQRSGLDPFRKQIIARKQWNSATGRQELLLITTIYGARSSAESTGLMDGMEGPFFCGPDGIWTDVWLSGEPPVAAKVTIHRKDWQFPRSFVALFQEFAQRKKNGELNVFWARMPTIMLAKCAEMGALRATFPEPLSNVYIREELISMPGEGDGDEDSGGEREHLHGRHADEELSDDELVAALITELTEAAENRARTRPPDGKEPAAPKQYGLMFGRLGKMAQGCTKDEANNMSIFVYGKPLHELTRAQIGVWLDRWFVRRKKGNVYEYDLKAGTLREVAVLWRIANEPSEEAEDAQEGEFEEQEPTPENADQEEIPF